MSLRKLCVCELWLILGQHLFITARSKAYQLQLNQNRLGCRLLCTYSPYIGRAREPNPTYLAYISEYNPLFDRPNCDFERTKSSRPVVLRLPAAGCSARGAPPTSISYCREIALDAVDCGRRSGVVPQNPDKSGETMLARQAAAAAADTQRMEPSTTRRTQAPTTRTRGSEQRGGTHGSPRFTFCY